jgi:hypothetical protein
VTMKSSRRFDIPAAVVLVAMIAAIAALYVWGPAEERAEAIAGAAVFFGLVLSFMRQLYGAVALVLVILAAPFVLAGCSSGPQLPITTPVLNISCTWHENACPRSLDAGMALEAAAPATQTMGSSCDCLIDRSSSEAQAETTGNNVRDNTITPTVRTDVSAIP